MMVCGKRDIKIDYLRANTKYRNPYTAVSPAHIPNFKHRWLVQCVWPVRSERSQEDPAVKMLWEVLEAFSHDERQMFLVRLSSPFSVHMPRE